MTDRPIIFSAPMVRALIDGRKTQTRRVLKPQPPHERGDAFTLPFAAGDRLDPAIKVEGFPDYAVGISGAVYSKRRGAWQRMSPAPNSKGYLTVSLVKGVGRYTTGAVHRLVCEAFHGAKPSPSHQVRHINGNRSDPRAANLCWGTQAENWGDRRAHGNGCEGEKHPAAVLTDLEREHVAWAVARGLCSQRQAAAALGMTQSSIHAICSARAPASAHEVPDMSRFDIALDVASVKVEQLQEISREDAIAEGCESPLIGTEAPPPGPGVFLADERTSFARLWNSIHGPQAWDANPWVVAISFTVRHGNIDR